MCGGSGAEGTEQSGWLASLMINAILAGLPSDYPFTLIIPTPCTHSSSSV